jgi:iron complex outermembrane receptor protein
MKTFTQNIFTIVFFLIFSVSFAQNIEGVVTTSENIPLEAVNVVVKRNYKQCCY